MNEQDNEIGVMEKMEAHREGKLHRAFSIFIFNNKGEMLLQQRALINITAQVYGRMPAAVIQSLMKQQ